VMMLRRAMWSKTEEEDIYMAIIKLKKRAEEGSTSNRNDPHLRRWFDVQDLNISTTG
jgi:hypothetical protein